MDFDVVEYGYNAAEETINFGTRCIAECDNLYEATTLATFRASESNALKGCPYITAVAQDTLIYFTSNALIHIFRDRCSDLIFSKKIDAVIDNICVSPDSNYLLICRRDGVLELVDCKNEHKSVFTETCKRADNTDKFFINVFAHGLSFLIVTKNGALYRISYESEIKMECLHEFNFRADIASLKYPRLLVNGTKLAILDLEDNDVVFDKGPEFKKIMPLDQVTFLALDFEGNMFRICACSLIIFPVNNSILYKDMLVLHGSNKIEVVVVKENDKNDHYLQLLSYEGFTELLSIRISQYFHLIPYDSSIENLLYITKVISNESTQELRIHAVSETGADQRFQKLLKKHKYDEAERFALQFGLDTTLIKKARVGQILEQQTCSSQDGDNLINLLDQINDNKFRLMSCINFVDAFDKLEDTQRLLTYGSKLPIENQREVIAHQSTVTHLLHRLNTFLEINDHPEKTAWTEFATCNIFETICMLLRNCECEKAKIIYNRLDEKTTNKMTQEQVSTILDILDQLPIAMCDSFLPVFVTVTLEVLPLSLPLFLKWTYERVLYLEKRENNNFPDNAFKFTENIIGLMKVDDVADNSFERHENLVELSSYFMILRILKKLKDDYNIRIPEAGYLSSPQAVVRFLLGIELPPMAYNHFLKKVLCKYMVENQMDVSSVLLEQVRDLVKHQESYWGHKIGLILNCISFVYAKLEGVKYILISASVPWSATIWNIVNEVLKYPEELTSEIKDLVANEPIKVVLKNPKYELNITRISDITDFTFVVQRIMNCNESTMVADVHTLCTSPEFRREANILLTKHFIEKGFLERALEILDDNSHEDILECAKLLAVFIEVVINSELSSAEEVRNCYNISRSIFKRINDNEIDNTETLTKIQIVYNLNKHFKIKTTTEALRDSVHKNNIIDGVLEDILRSMETEEQKVDKVFMVCDKLAASLSMDKDDILVKLCGKCENYNVIIKIAQRICNSEASVKNLCSIPILLMKYLGIKHVTDNIKPEDSDTTFVLNEVEQVDDEIFREGMMLAQEITTQAMVEAGVGDQANITEVARWTNIGFYLNRGQICELQRNLVGDQYESLTVVPTCNTYLTIGNIFNAFCGYVTGLDPQFGGYLTKFNSPIVTKEEFLNQLKLLPPVLEQMFKEGQQFTAFKLVQTVSDSLMQIPKSNPSMLIFLEEIQRNECIQELLRLVFRNDIINEDLAYSLLLNIELNEATQLIVMNWKMYKRNPRKFASIAKIGLRFWEHHSLIKGKRELMNSLSTIKWWQKLESKKLDYEAFCKMKPENRLEFLINQDCLDIESSEEYCHDFDLSLDGVPKYFLKKIFLNWKPDYEILMNGNQRYLVVKNSEQDLLEKINKFIPRIDAKYVLELKNDVWNSVNSYYYEVFIAFIDILSTMKIDCDNISQLGMLQFLKDYQRVSTPTETEIEQWHTNFPDSLSVDPLSEFRLAFTPFLFTKNIFDIIRPELTLKTYKRWFIATNIVKILTKDQICSFVVKDIVASGMLSNKDSNEWVLYPQHEDLLKEIDECVKNIANLELTTSVVYHLVMHSPRGADQVAAAKLCYKYAIQYRQQNPNSGDVEKAATKVERRYFRSSAMHILYTHQFVEDSYMKLISQPEELICALYMTDSVLRNKEMGLQYRDINKTAEALADLFSLDIKKIRHRLIHRYLYGKQSTTLDFDSSLFSDSANENVVLNRIAYVCRSDDVDYWRTFLLEIGNGEESREVKNVHCKTKALKILAVMSDPETILKLTGVSYDEFRNYIDKVAVVSNLQYLGISLTVNELDRYNKKELLNRLVMRNGNCSIKTMGLIAMTYTIYNVSCWEFIINKSILSSLFNELQVYVKFLKKDAFLNKSFYINAWQHLTDNWFAQVNNTKYELLDDVLLTKFLTIQKCPVLRSLNLENAFKRCMDKNKFEFAAVLVQYLEKNRRREAITQIQSANKDLFARLDYLQQSGLCGIPYVKNLLCSETPM